MASRKNKTGITVAGILGGLAIVLITIIVIIQTGVWATVAPQFGLPAITSISQILPSEDSMQKTNIGLGLKKPDLSKIEGQIKDGLTSSGNTGEKDSTNTDMGASGLPASAASPMSVSEAITATRNLPTETPHTKGYNRAEDFGDWQNSDQLCGYGTTRDYILNRDLTDPVMDSNCKVQSGTLHDPYTGQTINFRKSVVKNGKTVSGDSTAVQIDHVVALNDAWASGLWKNSRKNDRVKYANDPDVKALIDTYNEFTGKHAEPFAMGGGTYARNFARAVSFGPEETGVELPEWGGQMHGPNECANEEQLKQALKIYIVAILRLNELEL